MKDTGKPLKKKKKEPINSKQIKDGFDPLATHILNQDSVLTP